MIFYGKFHNKMQVSPHEAFTSSHGADDLGEKTNKTVKYQENFLEGAQQVRMLQGNYYFILYYLLV